MRIAFLSTMGGLPWGGSEELWSRTALALLKQGHHVAFNYRRWPDTPAALQLLIEAGAAPHFRPHAKLGRSMRRALEKLKLIKFQFVRWLRKAQPDFVLISLSYHSDDPSVANMCRMLGIPYGILVQAAGPDAWISPRRVEEYRSAYSCAEQCYFVSTENREILESNLAIDLSQSEIVDNPFNVPTDASPIWPDTSDGWTLACVARIHFISKSQDLILRVLRSPKWRERPLKLTLYGPDHGSLPQLRDLINLYKLHDRVHYAGFRNDIERLWSEHHGLLLPSRVEGNALSLIEAMMCGRVPITTRVGRADELIDDNETGFIAPAATAELVDDALERAWQLRKNWQQIGRLAAQSIRARHSLRPAEDFAERILSAASPKKFVCSAAA